MRENAEHLETLAGDTAERMQRIEALKPQLDEAIRQLATLKGTHEMMADGLEQMRLAQGEMIRVRESHAETQTWLTTTDGWTRKVEAQVKELRAMEPAVERIRADVEQVRAAMGEIESRRGGRSRRCTAAWPISAPSSAELKDRAEGLRVRMDGAEGRFTQLAAQAEEAHRVSDTIAEVAASVGAAERRLDAVDGSVRGAREPHHAARRARGADPPAGPGARAAAGRARQGHRAPDPGVGAPPGVGGDGAAARGAVARHRHHAAEGRGAGAAGSTA